MVEYSRWRDYCGKFRIFTNAYTSFQNTTNILCCFCIKNKNSVTHSKQITFGSQTTITFICIQLAYSWQHQNECPFIWIVNINPWCLYNQMKNLSEQFQSQISKTEKDAISITLTHTYMTAHGEVYHLSSKLWQWHLITLSMTILHLYICNCFKI